MTEAPPPGPKAFMSENPGRDVQRVGTARWLGEDVAKIHDRVWGVVGTLGESQCYAWEAMRAAGVAKFLLLAVSPRWAYLGRRSGEHRRLVWT